MLYETLLRPWLFSKDPENAHDSVTRLLERAQALPGGAGMVSWMAGSPPAGLETEAFGLKFPNPVGLAAGFDKDCRLVKILPAFGFGFVELGSVTLKPQPGNPKPRVFRAPETRALVNRLGFPSQGAQAVAARLAAAGKTRVPLGLNLGLNADCPAENAPSQYAQTFKVLEPYGDYFVVNVSSPNTEGLRELQEKLRLERILEGIQELNPKRKPVLVKLSPDLSEDALAGVAQVATRLAAGIVAVNTTTSREGVPAGIADEHGGLSGPPLLPRAAGTIRKLRSLTGGFLPIVGVGGVSSGADAFELIRAGASLVQLYTSMVYGGPQTAVRVLRELAALLKQRGFASVAAAVGRAAPGVPA